MTENPIAAEIQNLKPSQSWRDSPVNFQPSASSTQPFVVTCCEPFVEKSMS